jgi:hypothetical protein
VKALIALAVVAALSQPLAAMAADTPTIPSSQTAQMAKSPETDAIVSKPSQNRNSLSTFQVPKALTAQQINDRFELEYDKLFNVTPGFHSP